MADETKHRLKTVNGSEIEVAIGPAADNDSFFLFSMQKAGSTLLNRMLTRVCSELEIPQFAPESEEFHNGVGLGTLDPDVCRFFHRRGYCFSGFRKFPNYLSKFDLQPFRKILLIRDPRDMITSHYFSIKLSHQIPHGKLGEGLETIRKELDSMTIDQYAIEYAPAVLQKFNRYHDFVFDDNLMVCRYEDVVFEKREWLAQILDFVGLELSKSKINEIADAHDIRPQNEDPRKHIRVVTPGDHKKKLQPKTIEFLNETLGDVLTRYDYCSLEANAAV